MGVERNITYRNVEATKGNMYSNDFLKKYYIATTHAVLTQFLKKIRLLKTAIFVVNALVRSMKITSTRKRFTKD